MLQKIENKNNPPYLERHSSTIIKSHSVDTQLPLI